MPALWRAHWRDGQGGCVGIDAASGRGDRLVRRSEGGVLEVRIDLPGPDPLAVAFVQDLRLARDAALAQPAIEFPAGDRTEAQAVGRFQMPAIAG